MFMCLERREAIGCSFRYGLLITIAKLLKSQSNQLEIVFAKYFGSYVRPFKSISYTKKLEPSHSRWFSFSVLVLSPWARRCSRYNLALGFQFE